LSRSVELGLGYWRNPVYSTRTQRRSNAADYWLLSCSDHPDSSDSLGIGCCYLGWHKVLSVYKDQWRLIVLYTNLFNDIFHIRHKLLEIETTKCVGQ